MCAVFFQLSTTPCSGGKDENIAVFKALYVPRLQNIARLSDILIKKMYSYRHGTVRLEFETFNSCTTPRSMGA